MDFRESTEYLYSLGNEVEAMKLGLDNIRKLLAALGNPERNYLKVQVAGTNGKGSVCAFLNSICLEARIKTGLYTSPHLVSVTERVKIDGVDISEDEFARLSTQIRKESERLVEEGELENVPTFFEQVTAIALIAFAEAKIDLAILETGLGGRFDAVTATNAEICAITRIDYDHQQYLGETIEEITSEKAAIIRKDSKVVVGEQDERAMKVVRSRCKEVGVEPQLARDASVEKRRNMTGRECGTFSIQNSAHSLPLVFPPVCLGLLGNHQIENAKVAILLSEVLGDEFPISNENLSTGLKKARHPGRLEYIGNFLLDGAHNESGAKALARFLDDHETRPITLVFAAMNDKKVHKILGLLLPRADQIVMTRTSNSRSMHLRDLLEEIPKRFRNRYLHMLEPVSEALKVAQNISTDNSLILVTGSLYLVGEARELLTRGAK